MFDAASSAFSAQGLPHTSIETILNASLSIEGETVGERDTAISFCRSKESELYSHAALLARQSSGHVHCRFK